MTGIERMREFQQGQQGKVKMRKEEEKRIKKAVYQMHVMVEDQCTKTLTKECEKSEKKAEQTRPEEEKSGADQKKDQNSDPRTEMERMIGLGGMNLLKARLNI